MTIVGASLGGVLSSGLRPVRLLLVAAVGLVVAAALAGLIRRPLQAPRDADEPAQRDLARPWARRCGYIAARPRVRALVTVKSAVGLGNGVLTVFPLLAAAVRGRARSAPACSSRYAAPAPWSGRSLMRPVLSHRSWLLPGLALSMAAYGLAYLGVVGEPWFPLVLVLVFVAHFAGGSNWVMSNYALQGEVPDRLRGRVFATDMMLATLAISVSQLVRRGGRRPGRRAGRPGRLRPDHPGVRDRLAARHPRRAHRHRAATSTAGPIAGGAGRVMTVRRHPAPSMSDGADLRRRPVRVRVPATSANLGPGFDALGPRAGPLRRPGRPGRPTAAAGRR